MPNAIYGACCCCCCCWPDVDIDDCSLRTTSFIAFAWCWSVSIWSTESESNKKKCENKYQMKTTRAKGTNANQFTFSWWISTDRLTDWLTLYSHYKDPTVFSRFDSLLTTLHGTFGSIFALTSIIKMVSICTTDDVHGWQNWNSIKDIFSRSIGKSINQKQRMSSAQLNFQPHENG